MYKELRRLTFYDNPNGEVLDEKFFENEEKAKEYLKEQIEHFGKIPHKLKKIKVY